MASTKNVNFVKLKHEHIHQDKDVEGEGPKKKQRVDDRPPFPPEDELCPTLADVPADVPMPVCKGSHCRYIHDLVKYLEAKPADLGPECYVYKLKGHCPKGVTCRYGAGHITETGRNMVNNDLKKKYEASGQGIRSAHTQELQTKLQRHEYDFNLSLDILKDMPSNNLYWIQQQSDIDFTEDVDFGEPKVKSAKPMDDRLGPALDTKDFRDHLARKKKLQWRDKLVMPAVPSFTSLPFRRICKEMGADVTCAETILANNIVEGSKLDWILAQRHSSEDIFGIQIFGNNPFLMTRAAQLVSEQITPDFIDMSFGNSIGELAFSVPTMPPSLVKCMARASSVPVTATLHPSSVESLASVLKACNVSLVTLEARKSTQEIGWFEIDQAALRLIPIPVFSYSDVFSYDEYKQTRSQHPHLTGVTVGRGALIKPWLFTEIKEQRVWDISANERLDILKKFANYGLEYWGSESKGVDRTRRFLLDWMQYLCRYVPVGLLEQEPQRVSDLSPKFIGRNELETIMGSQEMDDWIKITEWLLGPVQENFTYYPRVRRMAWPYRT